MDERHFQRISHLIAGRILGSLLRVCNNKKQNPRKIQTWTVNIVCRIGHPSFNNKEKAPSKVKREKSESQLRYPHKS